MITYEILANLVEIHRQATARQAATALLARRLPGFASITVEELTRSYLHSLGVFANYLRDGDIDKYRQYVQQVTRQQNEQGFSLEEIIAIGDTLANKITELVEREFAGPQHALVREKFGQRLHSLSIFGQAAAFNSSDALKKLRT